MRTAMAGARPLLKASMKQDARSIGPWIGGITALSLTSVIAYNVLFSGDQGTAEFVLAVQSNPAFNLIFGVPRDLTTLDGFGAWRSLALGGFFAALMAILIVVRNSRANEDSGQAELIASGAVGRGSRLGVAIGMAAIASVAVGVIASLATIVIGGGVAASITLAATFTASGLLFAGVAAVAAQVGADARTASSLAIAILGILFLIRGYIDTVDPNGWAVWLSPLGWIEQVAPGTENNWWPLLPTVVLAGGLVALSFVLQNHRDFAQGLIVPRPGAERWRGRAGILGFVGRINRGAIISWTLAFVILGLVFGMVSTAMIDILETNPDVAKVLASGATTPDTLAFGLLITLLSLLILIAAVYGVSVTNRIYSEELEYRVEPILAGQMSRAKYLASNAVIALLGPTFALLIGAVGLGWIAAAANDSISFDSVLQQTIVALPALWLLVGIALAAVGARPALRLVAWLAIVATFGLTILGPSLKLPDWVLGFSPLHHIPNVVAPDPDYVGAIAVFVVVCGLLLVSFVGFRRRDVL